jgi:hypothetical protein
MTHTTLHKLCAIHRCGNTTAHQIDRRKFSFKKRGGKKKMTISFRDGLHPPTHTMCESGARFAVMHPRPFFSMNRVHEWRGWSRLLPKSRGGSSWGHAPFAPQSPPSEAFISIEHQVGQRTSEYICRWLSSVSAAALQVRTRLLLIFVQIWCFPIAKYILRLHI